MYNLLDLGRHLVYWNKDLGILMKVNNITIKCKSLTSCQRTILFSGSLRLRGGEGSRLGRRAAGRGCGMQMVLRRESRLDDLVGDPDTYDRRFVLRLARTEFRDADPMVLRRMGTATGAPLTPSTKRVRFWGDVGALYELRRPPLLPPLLPLTLFRLIGTATEAPLESSTVIVG